MLIDIIAMFLLVMAIFKGFTKGLIVAVFSFVAFFIGLAAAMKLSAVTAGYLSENTGIGSKWLPVLAFILVFICVVLIVRIGAKAIESIAQAAMLGWLNRVGGILFYGLLYLFVFSIVLFYISKLDLLSMESSVTYPFIEPFAPRMLETAGKLFPFLKNIFSELTLFFDGISDKIK